MLGFKRSTSACARCRREATHPVECDRHGVHLFCRKHADQIKRRVFISRCPLH